MNVRRWLGSLFLGGGAVLVLTGCPLDPHTFTVTSTVDGVDATPGDGVCEMTVGAGDCSIRAAVGEANATAGTVVVNVPSGTYVLSRPGADDTNAGGDLDLTRTGTLTIKGLGAGAAITAPGLDGVLDNRSGSLGLEHIALANATGPGLAVRSGTSATVSFSSLHHNGGAGLQVDASATVNSLHSTYSTNGAGGVRVDGTFVADYVTVTANTGGGLTGTGASTIGQSILGPQASGTSCAAPITSANWNESDSSCGLTGANDWGYAAPVPLPALSTDLVPFHRPLPGSVLMDSIAPDSGVCGTPYKNIDQRGLARPVGHGCDRGAIEAEQASFVVTSAADVLDAVPGDGICDIGNGNCTLRAAVAEANAHPGPDLITLAADPTLTRAGGNEQANLTGDLDVVDFLTIEGGGHTINGGRIDRVIDARVGWLAIHHAGVTGGQPPNAGDGGGIQTNGDLELLDVDVHGNFANNGWGGGVLSTGTVVVDRSVVRDNSAIKGGGLRVERARIVDSTISGNGAGDGGGVFARSSLEVLRSTISGNGASTNGGGVYTFECLNPNGPCPSEVAITSSTISGNTAAAGAAIYRESNFGFGTVTIRSSTIVENVATGPYGSGVAVPGTTTFGATIVGRNSPKDCAYAATTSLGRNIDSDGSCGFGAGDLPSGEPFLAPLAANGGPTLTRLPYAVSPVRDAIPAGTAGLCDASLPIDQRGQARPAGTGCDVGAVEGFDPSPVPMSLVVTTSADGADTNPGDHVCAAGAAGCTLRAAITETNAAPHPLTRITIAAGVNPTLSIAGAGDDANATGDLDVLSPVTIFGGGATINAGGLDRVLDIASPGVVIGDVTIRGGRLSDQTVSADGAGVQVRSGGLVLERATVRGNRIENGTGRGGGLAALPTTTVVVRQSTFSANRIVGYEGRGGAIFSSNSTLSIMLDTLSGNYAFFGGALYVEGYPGVTRVRASTFTANQGWSTVDGTGLLEQRGTVIGPGTTRACGTTLGSDGTSTSFDATCGFRPELSNVDPLLLPLADNGGPTLTHRPALESPLRDRIVPGADCEQTSRVDQRGQPRPYGTGCDIGSFEGP